MRILGRYEHNSDPRLAKLLHEVTEQGWGNDSVGDLDEDGFHASLLIVEPAERQELTEAFDRQIPAGNWILTEDQQGLVTMDQYPTAHAARYAFGHLPHSGVLGRGGHHRPRLGRSAAGTRSGWTSAAALTAIGRPRSKPALTGPGYWAAWIFR